MRPVRPLARSLYGSRLYGTATPESDTDWKSVHLPSGRGILLGRHEDTINNSDPSAKNGAGDSDEESHSLRKFLRMAAAGEMLAIELLFVEGPAITVLDPLWHEVKAMSPKVITSQCLGFVGYTQRQAAKYGIKGSRVTEAKEALALIEGLIARSGRKERIGTFEDEIRAFCEGRLHTALESRSAGFSEKPFLIVCDRKIPVTSGLETAVETISGILRAYGRRAEAASERANVDWKSTMHALRVAGQAVELLETGKITFPRPDAAFLLEVRSGGMSKDRAAEMLEQSLRDVEAASARSSLPAEPDEAAIDDLLLEAHHSQIKEFRA